MSIMIDLHCHSSFSDGHLSPEELIKAASQAGVRLLALTDHDTVEGLTALKSAAKNLPIVLINGIEFSARWKKYDIHIIGLHFNETASPIAELIEQQRVSRQLRAAKIAEALEKCGVKNAFEKVAQIAGHQRIGRPHFANLLIKEGFAASVQMAFKCYLSQGRAAYVPTPWVSVEQAVDCITQAGGQAIIAHPLKYKMTRTCLKTFIEDFKTAGGMGVEVVSGEVSLSEANEMAILCEKFNLLASTGSDFHGFGISRIGLGRQLPLPANCTPVWTLWQDQK